MKAIIKNRSEILFLYDIAWANPNGDPADENKPRLDEETGKNIVTDVRLKRTVRDYFIYNKGYNGTIENKDVFVREIEYEPGAKQDAKLRALNFLKVDTVQDNHERSVVENFLKKNGKIKKSEFEIIKKNVSQNLLNWAIDIRLFGATVPFEIKKNKFSDHNKDISSSLTYTGPVQFKMGQSLHRVKLHYIKGTGAFASEAGKEQKTFREEWVLPYALICFYGVINENAAKLTHLTEDDVKLLIEALWNGTKNLISRSKMGQMPRLLMRIVYKEKNYHIGDLDKRIKLITAKPDEDIRGIEDYKLDMSGLMETLIKHKDKIEEVIYCKDELLNIEPDNFLNQLKQGGVCLKPCDF